MSLQQKPTDDENIAEDWFDHGSSLSPEQATIIKDFNRMTQGSWATDADYNRVNALLLHWVDDDMNVKDEVLRFKELLEIDLGFIATIYRIPSENASAELNFQLANFIRLRSLQRRSLTIIYYAGHADDIDESSPAGYSEWRAKMDGGPTLNWFQAQPALYAAKGDVLVILDCCHAAIKTRGSKEGKMEVLAACGSGSRVPSPGRLSFTSILVRQVRKNLKLGKEIPIRWLHTHLWGDKTEPGLTVTPVYIDLSDHDQRSIILKPLVAPLPIGFARRKRPPSSFLLLKVSLQDDPTGLQIANWLKSFPLKIVQDVNIEGLVLKARRLEDLQTNKQIFCGSVLGNISPSAQGEILQKLLSLTQTISNAADLADEETHGVQDANTQLQMAEEAIHALEAKVSNVCESVETGILLDSKIHLEEAAQDEVALVAGAEDAITLKQYLLDKSFIPDSQEIPKDQLEFVTKQRTGTKQRLRYATLANRPVLIESFQYATESMDSLEPYPAALQQLKRMVGQLSHPKRTSFHILPSVGYIQEKHIKRFGIVFELSEQHIVDSPPVTLMDLYGSQRRVPLGLRFHVAHALAVALSNFHRVGWVHKDIRSDNIRFVRERLAVENQAKAPSWNDTLQIDFAQPYLFSFECARPEDIESDLHGDFTEKNNAYRHPERWGQPSVKFEKYHDVYSLGIVCYELACWKVVMQSQAMKASDTIVPEKMREMLFESIRRDLPHRIGQRFADVIDACLRFKELTEGLDDFQKHQVYTTRILEKLERGAMNV